MLKSVFATIGIFFASVFGIQHVQPVAPVNTQPAAAVVTLLSNGTSPTAPKTQVATTSINQNITQPVIEQPAGNSSADGGIDENTLNTRLSVLRNDLLSRISHMSAAGGYVPVYLNPPRDTFVTKDLFTKQTDAIYTSLARSVLTDADIPDSLTASNYVPITGGTISGALTVPYIIANSSTATSSFAGAFSIGSTTPAGSSLFSVGTSSPLFTVDNVTGNVGIGTLPNPVFKLHIVGSNTSTALNGNLGVRIVNSDTTTNNFASIKFGSYNMSGVDSVATIIGTQFTDRTANDIGGDLYFQTRRIGAFNTAERMRITGAGDVGIGTSSPYARLSILGSVTASTTLAVKPAAAQTANVFDLYSNTGLGLVFTATGNLGIGTSSPFAKLAIHANNNETNTRLFEIASSTAGGTASHFVVTNAGRVGIGIANPNFKLDVSGLSHFNNGATDTILSDTVGDVLGSGGYWRLRTGANNRLASDTWNGSAWQESTTILGGGNVGISTTTPWRKLSVTGTVGFDGLTAAVGAGSLCLSSTREVVYNSGTDACLSSLRATKHDVQNLDLDALSLVTSLQPVSFVYNDGDGRVRYGFIAEDAAGVDPHLATYDASSTLSGIDDRSIIAIVVKALQALSETVASFAERLVTKEVVADNGTFLHVTADEGQFRRLCVDGVCVTGDQLRALLEATGPSSLPPAPAAPANDNTAPDDETAPLVEETPAAANDNAEPADVPAAANQ